MPACSSRSTSIGRSARPASAGTWGLWGCDSPRWLSLVISTWARPASSTGFARMSLTVTTRPPSGWTLKSSASRSLGFPTACRLIITAFDLTDVQTLGHTRQWLEDALRENEPGSCFVFLVGTKKDLLSGAACEQAEVEAVRLANEMQAEYWSVSAKTGENVKAFFSRIAALAFEQSVLQDLERRSGAQLQEWRGVNPRPRRARHPPAWVAVSWGLRQKHGQCLP
ncbi:ras-related protein Rab-36 isoform X3 [Phoca vitulina]|uniref:ras-related protein Rab-36 isoform X3 n=1 Tax=Phoca vitulina TaxID=9720 RepID=UPI0013960B74|nr:ras-related protein Rab-36 isoform X3 [Phoca vitulina]